MKLTVKDGNKVLTVGMPSLLRSLSLNNETLKQLLEPGNADDIEVVAVDEDGESFVVSELEITVVNPVDTDSDKKDEITVVVSGGVVQGVNIPYSLQDNVSVIVKDYDIDKDVTIQTEKDDNGDEFIKAVWPL